MHEVDSTLEDRMAAAMAKAVREVVTDPDVIAAVGSMAAEMLQKQAMEKTGGYIWAVFKSVVSRWVLVVIIFVLITKSVGLSSAMNALGWLGGKG